MNKEGVNLDGAVSRAVPALQVLAVVLSYLTDIFQRIGGLLSFATGITSLD